MLDKLRRNPIQVIILTIITFICGQIIESFFGTPIQNWFQKNVWDSDFFLKTGLPFFISIVIPLFLLVLFTYILFFLKDRSKQKENLEPDQLEQKALNPTLERSPQDTDLLKVLAEVGIVNATTKLSATQFEPTQCMEKTQKHLYFMGILGSKWVNTHGGEFEKFLRRLESKHGEARFLLINPEGKAYSKLFALREGNIKIDSLKKLHEFSQKYECLRVKLYDDLPSFRLILIDELTLALSRYKLDRQGHFESKYGWEAPHIVISATTSWSFYWAFEHYYLNLWNSSIDLEDYVAQKNGVLSLNIAPPTPNKSSK